GAVAARPGRFEAANGGTIFLDEIGELPAAVQAKLLRVLQQREVERIGSQTPRAGGVRVRTATNRGLAARGVRPGGPEEPVFPATSSERTCSSASTSCRSTCRRCASGPRTCRG